MRLALSLRSGINTLPACSTGDSVGTFDFLMVFFLVTLERVLSVCTSPSVQHPSARFVSIHHAHELGSLVCAAHISSVSAR